MSKAISMVTAIAGFYLFPNLLATDLAEHHTVDPAVYLVYIIAVLSLAYYAKAWARDEVEDAYRKAEKAAEKAIFEERMKEL